MTLSIAPTPVPRGLPARPASAPAVVEGAGAAAPAPSLASDASRPPPLGFEMLTYTPERAPGAGDVPLLRSDQQPAYVNGAVGTPPEAGQLAEGGAANFLNPAWVEQVELAARRNGGLGNAEDGYLAFSREHGFVRLKNTGLSPEQNRRLAEISLQTGWPVEKLPSRTGDSAIADPKVGRWVDDFIGRFDQELVDFKADPVKNGISVKDGRRRFKLEFNEQAGGVVSYDYKKKGGFGGFVQKHMKFIGPVLDGLSLAANVIPGLGQAAALGLQAVKTGLSWAATGTLKAGQLLRGVASALLPGAAGSAARLVAQGAAGVAATAVDTGRIGVTDLAGAFARMIPGLSNPIADQLVHRGLPAIAQAIDTGRLDASTLAQVLAPVIPELVPGKGGEMLGQAAAALQDGRIGADDLSRILNPLVRSVSEDRLTRQVLEHSLAIAAQAVETGRTDPVRLLELAGRLIVEQLRATSGPKAATA